MTNDEARITNQVPMTNDEGFPSSFGIRHCFVIRISSFGLPPTGGFIPIFSILTIVTADRGKEGPGGGVSFSGGF
jgi:hypothetical protein